MGKIGNWIRRDGWMHIIASFVIVYGASLLLPLWAAVVTAAAIGLGKEGYDYITKKGTAELHDLICDGIGILVAAGLILLLAI